MTKSHFNYFSKHWHHLLWSVCKESVAWFSVFLATFSAALAIAPETSATHVLLERVSGWVVLVWPPIVFVLIIIVISAVKNWPRMQASYHDLRTDTEVIIECADLLEQDGLKVIHSVDTFDTALGTIITPRSLHGAFLKLCKKTNFPIDEELDKALKHIKKSESNANLPGRQQRYPIGSACPIEVNGEPFALVSFAHLQEDGSIQITRQEYTEFLMKMWDSVSKSKIREEVINVAVIGNQFIDLPADFTIEQKIDIMVQTFFVFARNHTTCKTLRICVHEKNAAEVDFYHYSTIIEHLAKRPELNF
ncbi:MAG: DUF6430 domain-containing protein [Bacteroidaceae bacterium]|nr:DUF6430 domain-containing protein [Bacteroidaceae bacterium]